MNNRKKRARAVMNGKAEGAIKQRKAHIEKAKQYAEEHKHIHSVQDIANAKPTRVSGAEAAQRVYEYYTQVLVAAGVDELKARYIASPILGIDNKILSREIARKGGLTEAEGREAIRKVYYSYDVADEDLVLDAETAIMYVQGFIEHAQQLAAEISTGTK